MSSKDSPGLVRPNLPLRGRSRHVPTKRNFIFPSSWKTNASATVEKYAKVRETESGRGKIIEPAGGALLSRNVDESPVPVIISNTETEEDEEEGYEKEDRGHDSSESNASSPQRKSKRNRQKTSNISGTVTLNESGELLLSPSRTRNRSTLKTFVSDSPTKDDDNATFPQSEQNGVYDHLEEEEITNGGVLVKPRSNRQSPRTKLGSFMQNKSPAKARSSLKRSGVTLPNSSPSETPPAKKIRTERNYPTRVPSSPAKDNTDDGFDERDNVSVSKRQKRDDLGNKSQPVPSPASRSRRNNDMSNASENGAEKSVQSRNKRNSLGSQKARHQRVHQDDAEGPRTRKRRDSNIENENDHVPSPTLQNKSKLRSNLTSPKVGQQMVQGDKNYGGSVRRKTATKTGISGNDSVPSPPLQNKNKPIQRKVPQVNYKGDDEQTDKPVEIDPSASPRRSSRKSTSKYKISVTPGHSDLIEESGEEYQEDVAEEEQENMPNGDISPDQIAPGSVYEAPVKLPSPPRRSARKSMSRYKIAVSPGHSVLLEEEGENSDHEVNSSKQNREKHNDAQKDIDQDKQKRRTKTRQSLLDEYSEKSIRKSTGSALEKKNESLMFDDKIEGGHFAQNPTMNISVNGKSLNKGSTFVSFNTSNSEYRLQRHSTPIPKGKRGENQPLHPKLSAIPKMAGDRSKKGSTQEKLGNDKSNASKQTKSLTKRTEEAGNASRTRSKGKEKKKQKIGANQDDESDGEQRVEEDIQETEPSPDVESGGGDADKGRTISGNSRNNSSTPKQQPAFKTPRRVALFSGKSGAKANKETQEASTSDSVFKTPNSTNVPKKGRKTKQQMGKTTSGTKRTEADIASFMSAGTSFQVGAPQASAPDKASKDGAKKKRVVLPEPEVSMSDKPEDVRIWQDKSKDSRRTFSDITDLDVVLEHLETQAWDMRESMMDPLHRAVITKFMGRVQREIRDAITDSHRVRRLTNCVNKLGAEIKRKRASLLELHQEKAELSSKVAEMKKRAASPMKCTKSMKEISDFLNDLSKLKEKCDRSKKNSSSNEFVTYGLEDTDNVSPSRGSLHFQ